MGQRFIVVGATSGLGLEIARCLRFTGHEPIIIGNEQKEVLATCKELDCVGYTGDVAHPDDVQNILYSAFTRHGDIAGVVHCAARWLPAGQLHELSLPDIALATSVNVTGAMMVTHQTVAHMRRQDNGGRLVLIGAMAAVRPAPRVAAYAGHKAAVGHFGVSTSRDYVPNIRITVVNLGSMLTRLQERVGEEFTDTDYADPAEVAQFICDVVLLRPGNLTPERIDLAGSTDKKR